MGDYVTFADFFLCVNMQYYKLTFGAFENKSDPHQLFKNLKKHYCKIRNLK